MEAEVLASLDRDGFALVSRLDGLESEGLERLRREADHALAVGEAGARNALGRSVAFAELAERGAVGRLAREVLGPGARAVLLTIFDKTPTANWKVPWHRDRTIAVRERGAVAGFGPWSVKGGVPHVQAPAEVLAGLLAVRVHLDDTPAEQGALRVIPGSHRAGRIENEEVEALRRERGEVSCPVPAGGALLMRPLILHASSAAATPTRRRVLHYLYAAAELPGGLEWA